VETSDVLKMSEEYERRLEQMEAQLAEKDDQIEGLIESLGRQQYEIKSLKGLLQQQRMVGDE